MIIKPDFKAFVLFKSLKLVSLLMLYGGLLSLILLFIIRSGPIFVVPIPLIIIFISFILLGFRWISYSKTQYELADSKIIIKTGTLLSSFTSEINYENLVKLFVNIPYIENQLFKTGNLELSSAATSSLTKFSIQNVPDPTKIFEYISTKSEVSLHNSNKPLQVEYPDLVGIILAIAAEGVWKILGIMVSIYYILRYQTDGTILEDSQINLVITGIVVSGIIFSSIKSISMLFIKFIDILKREYRLYKDRIIYNDGFLNKNTHLILLRNISDTTLTQNILQNLLGIYTIQINAKGASNQILLDNLKNGQKFEQNISRLISSGQSKPEYESNVDNPTQVVERTALFYIPDKTRATAGFLFSLPFFLFIPILVYSINELIKSFFSKYSFDSSFVTQEYKFIQTKIIKFNIAKITSFSIYENILDRMFKTQSFKFTSYGNSEEISFSHIPKTLQLDAELLNALGLHSKNKIHYQINTKVHIYEFLLKKLTLILVHLIFMFGFLTITFVTQLQYVAFASLIAVGSLMFILLTSWLRISSQIIKFSNEYIAISRGILIKQTTYIRYKDIKDMSAVGLPLSNYGDLTLSIAGDQSIETQEEQRYQPNEISLELVPDINTLFNTIDNSLQQSILLSKPITEIVVHNQKPNIINSVFFFLIIPILWPLLPIIFTRYLTTRYTITDKRIIKTSGLVFKTTKSVLISKIDFVDTHVNIINKLFKTGSIIINTSASALPEIVIENIENFEMISQNLKQKI